MNAKGGSYGATWAAALLQEIKAEMGRQDISRAQLGRRVGLSEQQMKERFIRNRSGGRTPLKTDELADIAGVLGLSVGELVRRATRAIEEPPPGKSSRNAG